MVGSVVSQANNQTAQNFNIDISKIFSDFIQEIDANRSIVNIVNTTAFDHPFDLQTIASLNKLLKVESTPQESRSHAFYRLIGFPVIGQTGDGYQYYNPGLDTVRSSGRKVTLSEKIKIANSQSKEFQRLSLQRESYVNRILNVFNTTPPTISSIVLALTSSTHVRKFSVPVTNANPFSFDPANQTYTDSVGDVTGIVGKNQVPLNLFVDEFGNSVFNNGRDFPLFRTRSHFVQPYIVDARIDFTVNPSSRLVSIPFVPNKKDLLISENTFVKRPLIEKVIRDRLASNQNVVISPSQQSFIDYIKNVPSVKNDNIIKQITSGAYSPTTQAQVEKFLFIIEAMCIKLVEAQLKIQKVQSLYYWLPLPSTIGPEGGSQVKGIIISQELPNTLITVQDRAIINATLNQAAKTFDTQTASADGVPDLGGFAFNAFNLTFNSDTSASLGDNTTQELDRLNKVRNHDLGVANNALQTIEIIMGEWSGLGLCDIVAVMGALYTMPQDELLGFLDDDAFVRMTNSLNLQNNQLSNPGIQKAITSFITTVKDYYNLMDDIYKDVALNNKLNV